MEAMVITKIRAQKFLCPLPKHASCESDLNHRFMECVLIARVVQKKDERETIAKSILRVLKKFLRHCTRSEAGKLGDLAQKCLKELFELDAVQIDGFIGSLSRKYLGYEKKLKNDRWTYFESRAQSLATDLGYEFDSERGKVHQKKSRSGKRKGDYSDNGRCRKSSKHASSKNHEMFAELREELERLKEQVRQGPENEQLCALQREFKKLKQKHQNLDKLHEASGRLFLDEIGKVQDIASRNESELGIIREELKNVKHSMNMTIDTVLSSKYLHGNQKFAKLREFLGDQDDAEADIKEELEVRDAAHDEVKAD